VSGPSDGPTVVLGSGGGSTVASMLRALGEVSTSLGRPFVLVGGIAVAARLGRVERATRDVDAVVDAPTGPPSVEVLLEVAVGAERAGSSSVMLRGVPIDLIDTHAIPPLVEMERGDGNDLFVLAHRFGFETATPMNLVVEGGCSLAVQVAEPPGLIAMKLHAARWRRDRTKLPSDLYDLFRLLVEFDVDGSATSSLLAQPGLGPLCLGVAEDLFANRLTASAGAMSRSDDAVISSVSRADLADVGGSFLRRLDLACRGS
jgi:hypothetical protein